MKRDTLKRALGTAMAACGVWLVLRGLGVPSVLALIGPGCVVVVSHQWVGTFALARADAVPVPMNTPHEHLRVALGTSIKTAIEIGLAAPRVFVSDSMNRYAFAAGKSRFNPAVCIHTDLLNPEYEEVLVACLRSEMWYAKIRLPQHGTLWAACSTLTLCAFTW